MLETYADRLVCVRYRYDEQRKKRFKTVELIIAEVDWSPPPPPIQAETIVGVRVGLKEREMQRQVKRAGGKWNPERRVWELCYKYVKALGLEKRIVEPKVTKYRDS